MLAGFLRPALDTIHHEGIIDQDARYVIKAMDLESVGQFIEAWQLGRRRGRCMGAGQGENYDNIAVKQFGTGNPNRFIVLADLETGLMDVLSFFVKQADGFCSEVKHGQVFNLPGMPCKFSCQLWITFLQSHPCIADKNTLKI